MSPHDRAHAILGLAPDASIDDLTQAYRRAAMRLHPDRGGDGEQMARLNAAFDALFAPDPIIRTVLRPPREANCYSDYSNLHRRAL
jgi:hypothetical protein